MKATGIVRRIDPQGRVVLPKELRIRLGFSQGVDIAFLTRDGGEIVLQRYKAGSLASPQAGTAGRSENVEASD